MKALSHLHSNCQGNRARGEVGRVRRWRKLGGRIPQESSDVCIDLNIELGVPLESLKIRCVILVPLQMLKLESHAKGVLHCPQFGLHILLQAHHLVGPIHCLPLPCAAKSRLVVTLESGSVGTLNPLVCPDGSEEIRHCKDPGVLGSK